MAMRQERSVSTSHSAFQKEQDSDVSVPIVDMAAQVLAELEKWKTKRFRENEISLTRAVHSLSTDRPLIQARPGRLNSRWIVRTIFPFGFPSLLQ